MKSDKITEEAKWRSMGIRIGDAACHRLRKKLAIWVSCDNTCLWSTSLPGSVLSMGAAEMEEA